MWNAALIIRDSLPLTSPLDTNMGTRYYLLMSSRIDSTLYRRQTVASAVGHPSGDPGGGRKGVKGGSRAGMISQSALTPKAGSSFS